jgi:lactate dehydrogenase-like 2-hydroxyacid dehydrogenase
MSKIKLLVTRAMPPNVHQRAVQSYDATTNPDDTIYTPAQLLKAAEGQAGILCCASEEFTADAISKLPESVKIISTFSVGYEHIDVAAASRRGIVVTNTPDVLTDATADITLLCMLGAARRGSEGERMVRAGHWKAWSTTMLLGTHMSGKRLGIFGMGRIGRAVAQRARGFDMQIHYHNRSRLPAEHEQGAVYHENAKTLLAASDFLSINAPASSSTSNFLDAAAIESLPEGAIVVNTARGNLVADDALISALKSGRIAAAGLDVFAGEPNLDERYKALDNTFLLPHIGSATKETRDAMGFCCLTNLDTFFAGQRCPNALEI